MCFLEGKNISVEGCLWPDVARSSVLISSETLCVCVGVCIQGVCMYTRFKMIQSVSKWTSSD